MQRRELQTAPSTYRGAPSGMPEIYAAILTKRELRDVVEYLASVKETVTTLDENKPRALRGLPKATESQ